MIIAVSWGTAIFLDNLGALRGREAAAQPRLGARLLEQAQRQRDQQPDDHEDRYEVDDAAA